MATTKPLATRLVTALPRRAVTNVMGVVASLNAPTPVRAPLYRGLAAAVGAELGEVDGALNSFATLNAFFARPLREGARPWRAGDDVGSPADGRLDACGRVEGLTMIQAKGIDYDARDLVAGAMTEAELEGASYATVYLSPRDYHRVHMPCGGTVTRVLHIGGDLWPVNGTSVPYIDGLFRQNERIVFRIERGEAPPVALVMVGATVVGQMTTTCDGAAMLTDRDRGVADTPGCWEKRAGDEIGAFLLGSTAIVIAADPERRLRVTPESGAALRVGEPLLTR